MSEIENVTIKSDSSMSNVNICYYLKLPMPIMYKQFFRIVSRNPECVKTLCFDRNNPFHFACRRWIINQQFEKDVKTDTSLKDYIITVSDIVPDYNTVNRIFSRPF